MISSLNIATCFGNRCFVCKGLRVFLLFFFTVFFLSNINGQNKCFTVVDSSSNEAIPYCNVVVNNKEGLVTNHLGQFCVPSFDKDSLMVNISNISYNTQSFFIHRNDTNSVFYLASKSHSLTTIDINWSKYKFKWLGNYLKQPDGYINLWRFCQLGICITPTGKYKQVIESVSVPIYNAAEVKVPFRLHVFSVKGIDEVGEELLPENIYVALDGVNEEVLSIDLLEYQIEIPTEGVFVTLELLSNNKPDELFLGKSKYYEKDNNRIGYTHARYRHRKIKKVSSWRPNSFYVEEYPYTKVEGMVGDLPLIKVKVRSIKK